MQPWQMLLLKIYFQNEMIHLSDMLLVTNIPTFMYVVFIFAVCDMLYRDGDAYIGAEQ